MTTLTHPSAVQAMEAEIIKIDKAMLDCQDENGVVHNWCKYRLSALVEQREIFHKAIEWMTKVYNREE